MPPPAAVALPASFLIVFDETHLSPEQARTARGFSADLLQRARPGDRVTLVATHDGRWWTGVAPEGAPDVLRQLDQLQGRLQRDAWPESMSPYEAQRIVQGDRAVERVVVGRMRDRGITPPPGGEAAGSLAYRTDPRYRCWRGPCTEMRSRTRAACWSWPATLSRWCRRSAAAPPSS